MSLAILCSCIGRQGIQGEKGDTGEQGQPGEDGTDGKDGLDGHAPTITIGENGNWYIDGVDTGVPVEGEKGDTGEQGVQGEAGPQGPNGEQGQPGKDGIDGKCHTLLFQTVEEQRDIQNQQEYGKGQFRRGDLCQEHGCAGNAAVIIPNRNFHSNFLQLCQR